VERTGACRSSSRCSAADGRRRNLLACVRHHMRAPGRWRISLGTLNNYLQVAEEENCEGGRGRVGY